MARPLRIEYEGALYHVTARGNERKRIYFTKRDYLKFREYIADAQEKYRGLGVGSDQDKYLKYWRNGIKIDLFWGLKRHF